MCGIVVRKAAFGEFLDENRLFRINFRHFGLAKSYLWGKWGKINQSDWDEKLESLTESEDASIPTKNGFSQLFKTQKD